MSGLILKGMAVARKHLQRQDGRARSVSDFSVGKTVQLGRYLGKPVEWLVLAADGDKRTLIAVEGPVMECFNESESDGNRWENSHIRTWLNDEYYFMIFNAKEQALITAGPTGDNVWLLSAEEAERYFRDDDARQCRLAMPARFPGAHRRRGYMSCWWLRSSGTDSGNAAFVAYDGSINTVGCSVEDLSGMVRPVVDVQISVQSLSAYSEAEAIAKAQSISEASVGQTVWLGYYGGEPVEWLVLAAEGNTRTLIAVKGQDAVCFEDGMRKRNRWMSSFIRYWLNSVFYDMAFTTREQAMITAGPTGDKVWLLSAEEAEQYFENDDARVCYPTTNATADGADTDNGADTDHEDMIRAGAGRWWLRSPGSDSGKVAYVDYNGGIDSEGISAMCGTLVTRPVVVVELG